MAEDDLEYHIKFPSPTPKESTPNSENEEFVFLYNEEKLPVVVLLGWAGCQDKYLSKYSALYETRGCITLRYTAPVVTTFMRHDKLPRLAVRLLDLITDMSLDDHPIFFHIFSNGGTFLYQYISQEMQKQQKPLQVKGVIFDSAPGERRFYSVYRAIGAIVGGPQWYNIPMSIILAAISFIFFLGLAYMKALSQWEKPQTEPIVLNTEPYTWPQLFIYSKADQLVSYEDVTRFAKHREARGVKVERLFFEDSPHVQHLMTHREVYVTRVVTFLQDCLNTKTHL